MGYRYGEHKYSEKLYSRWPDWWHTKACINDTWDEKACAPLVVEIVPPPASSWVVTVADPNVWASTPEGVPHPEQWKRGSQQAVVQEKERLWRIR